MLRPTKFSAAGQTVLPVAAEILGHLQRKRIEPFDALRQRLRERNAAADSLFVPALGLLFLLGRVEYRPKTDSLEYVGPV